MQSLDDLLRSSHWAKALQADEFERLRGECYEKRVPAGGLIVRRGDVAESWCGLIAGLMKLSLSLPDGREWGLVGATSGAWFGEGTLLRAGIWRYDVVAMRASRVACVPRASFQRLVQTSLPFNHALLALMNARLSLFIGMCEIRLHGPNARVARYLASLFDPDLYPNQDQFLPLSQADIGLLAGVSRQRANEALRVLEDAGLIRIEFRGVTVLDLAGLRSYTGPLEESAVSAKAKALRRS